VSEEREKFGSAPDEKFANDDDVEAHKMGGKFGTEPDEKFEADEDDDVEAHMLGSKNTPKNQP
jgi:hypothetical protein